MNQNKIKINPTELVSMQELQSSAPIYIDLAYSKANHPDNIFGQLYKPNAKLYLHPLLANIVIKAAKICQKDHNWQLRLYDGYRPTEAQEIMANYNIDKTMLAKKGEGGHPRGMAIDLQPQTNDGKLIDMGTRFDYFPPDIKDNPSARDYKNLPNIVKENRQKLTKAMRDAAKAYNLHLLPLPSEWWDFRLEPKLYNKYAPLKNTDLPKNMRMMHS